MLLDVKLKGLPNEELVQGYPGIPATWPRVAGTVEVRYLPSSAKESTRTPLKVQKVSVALLRTDSIVIPSHRPSVAAQKREKSFLVTRQKEIYRTPTSDTDVYFALDVPFTLSLPTNKAPCGSISLHKTLESTYHLYITLETISSATNSAVASTYQFPVRIRRFDTLATFGMFNKPINNEASSNDHLVSLEWSLPVSAYGPGDKLSISMHAQPNRDWPKSKKVKLKRFSVELVQMTKYFIPREESAEAGSGTDKTSNDSTSNEKRTNGNGSVGSSAGSSYGGNGSSSGAGSGGEGVDVIETRTRIAKASRDFTSSDQENRVGIERAEEIDLPIPSVYHSDGGLGALPKESPSVGYSGRSAFTNTSSLYNIEFKLVLKARFSHAKDIETEQPITISQFDHFACMSYMNSLVEAAQRLKYLDPRPHPPHKWTEPLDTSVRIV